eukprot:TRINITY_DN1168_c0_g1_i2.p1 TRINITY_DN1168_c0_g1~~TRINITY_DN1168_c0_g1_i2.p1  ORF type:complete len:609 (-),score=89.79 TRINITY_DN1168_c0_g1_i2:1371-3197(-)
MAQLVHFSLPFAFGALSLHLPNSFIVAAALVTLLPKAPRELDLPTLRSFLSQAFLICIASFVGRNVSRPDWDVSSIIGYLTIFHLIVGILMYQDIVFLGAGCVCGNFLSWLWFTWQAGRVAVLEPFTLLYLLSLAVACRSIGTLLFQPQVQAPRKPEQTGVLASVSSGVRTYLNDVAAFTVLIPDKQLTSEQRDFMESLHESEQHLLSLINGAIDLVSEDTSLRIVPVDTDVLSTAESCIDAVGEATQLAGVELVLHVDSSVPAGLMIDAARMQQITQKLLQNAINYTERGGDVTARFSYEDGLLQLVVTDSGCGMSADELDRLFEPKSSGLQLAVCKHVATAMGGTLTATSVVGKGTVYNLKVKALVSPQCTRKASTDSSAATGSDVAAAAEVQLLGGRTVVVMSAHLQANRAYSDVLTARGMHVEQVLQLVEATARLHSCSMGESLVMVVDLYRIDTVTALRLLRAVARVSRAAVGLVVLLSPAQLSEVLSAGFEVDEETTLTKPVAPTKLCNAVDTAMCAALETRQLVVQSAPLEKIVRSAYNSSVRMPRVNALRTTEQVVQSNTAPERSRRASLEHNDDDGGAPVILHTPQPPLPGILVGAKHL